MSAIIHELWSRDNSPHLRNRNSLQHSMLCRVSAATQEDAASFPPIGMNCDADCDGEDWVLTRDTAEAIAALGPGAVGDCTAMSHSSFSVACGRRLPVSASSTALLRCCDINELINLEEKHGEPA